jgi:predicted  nucleic acid-binding Zn-ribbon protein
LDLPPKQKSRGKASFDNETHSSAEQEKDQLISDLEARVDSLIGRLFRVNEKNFTLETRLSYFKTNEKALDEKNELITEMGQRMKSKEDEISELERVKSQLERDNATRDETIKTLRATVRDGEGDLDHRVLERESPQFSGEGDEARRGSQEI